MASELSCSNERHAAHQCPGSGIRNAQNAPRRHSNVSRPEALISAGLEEILEVAAHAYVPIGNETNRWIGTEEFKSVVEDWGKSDLCFGFGDDQGLTLETPFGDDSALIRLMT